MLKLCLFNNEFKVRLSKVTYLGYILNYLRQGQILVRQKYNLFKLKSSLFSDFNDLAYKFLDDAYTNLLHNRKVM